MGIDKINRVVLSQDVKNDLNSKASKTELLNTRSYLENQINNVVSNLVRKPSVATYNDISKTYPNPKEGWTLSVDDTNITYQYDSQTKTWIKTSINALPKATPDLDGLFTKEDKRKLDNIQSEAQANKTSKEILEEIKKIDGSDSGLDADMLDGKHAKDFANKEHEHDGRYYSKKDSDIKFATKDEMGKAGYGDMLKLTYDKNGNGKVDNAENAEGLIFKDNRDIQEKPRDIPKFKLSANFKNIKAIGSPVKVSDNYVYVLNVWGWGDPSGGRPIQVAFGNDGLAYRYGANDDKWSSWSRVANSNDKSVDSEQINGHKYSVGSQPPSSPQQNDIWIDTKK